MIYSNETGDKLPGTSGVPDGKCCVAGALNEKLECQIYDVECQLRLRSVQTRGGAPKTMGPDCGMN